MKKAYISPVTSLLMSLSLALGILVSDLRGYNFLTSAHAQESPCGEPSDFGGGTIILSGIEVSGLSVNGQLVEQGVIAGSVQLINSTIVNSYDEPGDTSGVVVGGGNSPAPSGVVVGGGNIIIDESEGEGEGEGGSPCTEGVVVGGGNGVVVGGGNSPAPSGVVVGGGNSPAPSGVVVGGGTVTGGLLTGDGINITDGVISGTNLVLTGATIYTGSIY